MAIKDAPKRVNPSLSARERLIVPLDFSSKEDAFRLTDELKDEVVFYKIGYQLFLAEGPRFVEEFISSTGKKVFLDLKMDDIERTIQSAVEVITKMGVEFLTLHGNGPTARAARAGRGDSETPQFLQITLFSSLDQADLEDLFGPGVELKQFVRMRAEKVLEVGCDGVIASGDSVADLRQHFAGRERQPCIVVPGIRRAGTDTGGHKRILTPGEAIRAGADYLVVGRPIRKAEDRIGAAKSIIDEISAAL